MLRSQSSIKRSQKKEKSFSLGNLCNFRALDQFGSSISFNINGEDTFKTFFGFFFTIFVVVVLLGSGIYFVYNYFDQSNVNTTAIEQKLSEYPEIDFEKLGFFPTILFKKGTGYVPPNKIDDFVTVDAFVVKQESQASSDGVRGDVSSSENIRMKFTGCKTLNITSNEVKINGQTLSGKKAAALSELALCANPKPKDGEDEVDFVLKGNPDSDLFKYVTITIEPCPKDLITCNFYWLEENNYINSDKLANFPKEIKQQFKNLFPNPKPQNDQDLAAKRLANSPQDKQIIGGAKKLVEDMIRGFTRDLAVQFNIMESIFTPETYSRPFTYTIDTNLRVFINQLQEKYYYLYFKEIEVETDQGLFWSNISTNTSVTTDKIVSDAKERAVFETEKRNIKSGPPGQKTSTESEKAVPYINFVLYSSNSKITYTRSYEKLLDIFASIGGVSEVVAFIVAILYAWYNAIRMEQTLMNYGIMNKQVHDDDVVGNEDEWEKTRFFSFKEIFSFGFSCFRKGEKYKHYERCKEVLETRTDIINIIRTLSDVETLRGSLLKPYQLRLLPYVCLGETEVDGKLKAQKMTVQDSVEILKSGKEADNFINEIIDRYLTEALPNDIIEGDGEKLNLSKAKASRKDVYKSDFMMESLKAGSRRGSKSVLKPERVDSDHIEQSFEVSKK